MFGQENCVVSAKPLASMARLPTNAPIPPATELTMPTMNVVQHIQSQPSEGLVVKPHCVHCET